MEHIAILIYVGWLAVVRTYAEHYCKQKNLEMLQAAGVGALVSVTALIVALPFGVAVRWGETPMWTIQEVLTLAAIYIALTIYLAYRCAAKTIE